MHAGAVEDFSVTIKEMPVYADAWMRRGQARAAMGEDEDALQDFEQCLKLTSEPARKVLQYRPHCLLACIMRLTAPGRMHVRLLHTAFRERCRAHVTLFCN